MLAHSIKSILSLIPEAMPLIKRASLDQDMPTDSRDSCIASALALKYQECISHKPVDFSAFEKVAQAVDLYGVKGIVNSLNSKMVKEASARSLAALENPKETFLTKQAGFTGELSGFSDIAQVSRNAVELYKQAQTLGVEPSTDVKRYSGHGYLDKKAAIESLAGRFQATGNTSFVKIASAIYKMDTLTLKPETILDICQTVSSMDKEAQISSKGFNFFKETVLVKSAASVLNVRLLNKDCPYETIARVGRDRVSKFIGEDVAKSMDSGPQEAKAVIETLPLDLQTVLSNLIKNT
jgi:hypothetical protein